MNDVVINKIATIERCLQRINIDIVRFIVENHLIDFQYFIKAIKLIPNL
jgi:hypothetical protein